jgi:hypothetical protein
MIAERVSDRSHLVALTVLIQILRSIGISKMRSTNLTRAVFNFRGGAWGLVWVIPALSWGCLRGCFVGDPAAVWWFASFWLAS